MTTRTLCYFAWVAELVGRDREQRAVQPDLTIGALLDELSGEGGGYLAAFADRNRLRFALDGEMADPGATIGDAREIAVFPPVTGG